MAIAPSVLPLPHPHAPPAILVCLSSLVRAQAMPYQLTQRCLQCGLCLPHCPTDAIQKRGSQFQIDVHHCNHCEDAYDEPQCLVYCPVNSPVPLKPRRGRVATISRPPLSPDLFASQNHHPFAAAIVSWELCKLLSQQQSLPWQLDATGQLYYERPVGRDRGRLAFRLGQGLYNRILTPTPAEAPQSYLDLLDIRAACLHLIYAAHATQLATPWETSFVISDRQIAQYLGLDQRRDLSKAEKLALIKWLAQQPCEISLSLDWTARGSLPAYTLEDDRVWCMEHIHHHFQDNGEGEQQLVGLSFRVRAGQWSQFFLNPAAAQSRQALYHVGQLPQSLLSQVMRLWQQHEGAVRLMLWLLFKTRLGPQQHLRLSTLMAVAYGPEKLTLANGDRDLRKRLIRTLESDLEILSQYGLKPHFDPDTYPSEIQPLWQRLAHLPEDAEAELEFWINDAQGDHSLTDSAPRNKWPRLRQAKLLGFDLPTDWDDRKSVPRSPTGTTASPSSASALTGATVSEARRHQGLSQRALAKRLGKSQSWIRDVENGRYAATGELGQQLRQVLGLANDREG